MRIPAENMASATMLAHSAWRSMLHVILSDRVFVIVSIGFVLLILVNIMTEFILTSCVVGDVRERVPKPECMDDLEKLANWREIYLKIDLAFSISIGQTLI